MAKLRDICLPLAIALSTFQLVRSRHKEAYEAETIVNELSKKLHKKLWTLEDTYHKTKEEIGATIKELAVLKKVDVLLGQLNNRHEPGPLCEHDYILVDFRYKQNILIGTRSALPAHYTISVQVNHKFLVDEKKTSKDGEDLRVFYLDDEESLPVEIDRIVTDLYTTSTTLQFKTQRVILANKVDTKSYALVFGGKSIVKPKADPKNVFLYHEDFSNSTLRDWKRVWGEWTVKNRSLFGKTGRSWYGSGEVGLYLKEGKGWDDIEVELDLMETGTNTVYPGPLLRVQESGLQHTTAWWFEYKTDHKECTMRPSIDNNDGGWKYKCQLPQPLVKNKWFHFKYRLIGNRLFQWANGVSIQNLAVESTWMIPRGTIAFGCHTVGGGIGGCATYYDNLRVRLAVSSNPTVNLGATCYIVHYNDFPDGDKYRPGDSCKQIHDANRHGRQNSSAKNGVYWLRTGINGEESTPTFCDMENGGWTLIGKISGSAGNINQRWLVENVNTELLKSPNANSRQKLFACVDARRLAVKYASEIMLSSRDNPLGIGAKWIRWDLPTGRDYSTWWNYGIGSARVKTAETHQVTVKAWNGKTQVCYQNKYGIKPLQQHGGSYPYTSYNRQGNTKVNDYCMAVGVLAKGSNENGWSQNANGYDSPQSDSDWPNARYNHQSPHLLVWLK